MTARRSKRSQGQSEVGKPRQKVSVSDAESVMTQTILKLFKTQQYVCADDVHRWLEVPPDCMKFVAHVFRGLQFRGVIRIVKIVNTPRDGQHGNRIAIWELVPQLGTDSAAVKQSRKPSGDRGSNAATVAR
jgi:hypothetical protein